MLWPPARSNHPNILIIYDISAASVESGGPPHVVAELLEGDELRAKLNDGAITPRKAVARSNSTGAGEHHSSIDLTNILMLGHGYATRASLFLAPQFLPKGSLGLCDEPLVSARINERVGLLALCEEF